MLKEFPTLRDLGHEAFGKLLVDEEKINKCETFCIEKRLLIGLLENLPDLSPSLLKITPYPPTDRHIPQNISYILLHTLQAHRT